MRLSNEILWKNLQTAGERVASDGPLINEDNFSSSQVHRAFKSGQLIQKWAARLQSGEIVALIPQRSTEEYEKRVAKELLSFQGYTQGSLLKGALCFPTSGSTGLPKLVVIPFSRVIKFISWSCSNFNFSSQTRSLSISPWNFDVSLLDTWSVLAAGGKVIACESEKIHDKRYLRNLLVNSGVDFIQLVPSTLSAVASSMESRDVLESVNHVVLTGGIASQSSRKKIAQIFPSATFYNVYGSTEVNDCFMYTMDAKEFGFRESLPLGQAISNSVIHYIEQNGKLVRPQRIPLEGELYVTTPWEAIGYIKGGAFEQLPCLKIGADRLHPTKDVMRFDGQNFHFRGRKDRTIKIRDQRVNLDQIESIACQNDSVDMAYAWATGEEGEQEIHLAYSAKDPLKAPSGLAIRIDMSKSLPLYAMPNKFHLLDSLPLNGNGKPDKTRIQQLVER